MFYYVMYYEDGKVVDMKSMKQSSLYTMRFLYHSPQQVWLKASETLSGMTLE